MTPLDDLDDGARVTEALAFLAFYRDWKVLLSATAVVASKAMRAEMAFLEFWGLVVVAAGIILAALPAPKG